MTGISHQALEAVKAKFKDNHDIGQMWIEAYLAAATSATGGPEERRAENGTGAQETGAARTISQQPMQDSQLATDMRSDNNLHGNDQPVWKRVLGVHDLYQETLTICRENGDGTCQPLFESCGPKEECQDVAQRLVECWEGAPMRESSQPDDSGETAEQIYARTVKSCKILGLTPPNPPGTPKQEADDCSEAFRIWERDEERTYLTHKDIFHAGYNARPMRESGWRSLDSAPRDGSTILGDYSPEGTEDGDDVHTVLYMPDWHGKGKGQWRDSTCSHDFAEPFRWMPVPHKQGRQS